MSRLENPYSLDGIAIIGMAGRFPGARNVDMFWQNLRDGVESISFFTEEELQAAGVDPALLGNPNYVKARGIIEDVELFDASFFGFNPREAEILDPQHRVFLECAWEALENAGYDPESYGGSIGIFAGANANSYVISNLLSNPHLFQVMGDFQIMISNRGEYLPTRISYKLNLKGPSLNIQTACSTSLVAVCQAYQSLLNYQCDIALAGGVSIAIPQKGGYLYQEGGITSPDGHCRAFDRDAQGTVFSNGLGIVVLKRLEDALAERDHIYAVIRGSAINNDGSLKVGYTAPSVEGQAEVVAMAQAMAEVNPETITYIETHGTGTSLGDPIEIAALTKVFRAATGKKGFCAIGSVKSNVGHLDTAAGIASLIKTTLALQHKLIPPSLHYERPNPNVRFDDTPFYVNNKLSEWPGGDGPRRAGVSAFGIGGTNAHVVLEEAPLIETSEPGRPWYLLPLSARSSTALEQTTNNLREHLRANPDLNLADVAYTLQAGRRAFSHRRVLVCSDIEDAVNTLETQNPQRLFTQGGVSQVPDPVFMFTGQGSQYVRMAQELYRVEPVFREQVKDCAELLEPYLKFDLRQVLYPDEDDLAAAVEQLGQTQVAQPALFVVEYALARLWMSWGIVPKAMIGHSIGEYVAACLAGVFTLEEALRLVAMRGRLMQQMPAGAMLAVMLPEEEVRPLLNHDLSLAAVNGPALCVVSGTLEAADTLQDQLAAAGAAYRRLHTSHAFHSAMMEPILASFRAEVGRASLKPPEIPFVSNVSGTWISTTEVTDPEYWARHLRQTVRFSEGLSTLFTEPDRVFLEIGPGHTLSSIAGQHPGKAAAQGIFVSLRHPQEIQSDVAHILKTLGQLWAVGVKVDWAGFYGDERRQRCPLPAYPFERQRYWIDPGQHLLPVNGQQNELNKRSDIADWFYLPSWKRQARPEFYHQPKLAEQKLTWLVFADECSVASGLVTRLKQYGHTVTTVQTGKVFKQLAGESYAINPELNEDYDALLKELGTLARTPNIIVHLWGVTEDKVAARLEDMDRSQNLGFYSLLYLAQALGKQNLTEPLAIQVVSNNMHQVTGDELICPEKSTVLGPCRVIPQEFPHISCRSIDIRLPEPASNGSMAGIVDQLLAEAIIQTQDPVVAYRGQYRWVQTFESIRLEAAKEDGRLKEKGVYLITGGLGGIGLVLAEFLARQVQARLVLTARSALPARKEWADLLGTHDDQDSTSRKIQKVMALEDMGAEVLVVSADVTNLEQMQGVIRQTRQRFGQLNGVVHAAGIAGGGMIQLKSISTAAAVLAPKVKGTLVLDAILANVPLDFFALCSSTNAIIAPFGQVDYAGANAFLDAFAYNKNAKNGTPYISINWDAWQEVGMAANADVPQNLRRHVEEQLKKYGIATHEGQAAFQRILSTRTPQIVVSTRDMNRLFEDFYFSKGSNGTEEVLESRSADTGNAPGVFLGAHARPDLPTAYVAPRNGLEEQVSAIWQSLLGVEQVGIHDNFFDLGGNSLIALQMFAQIEQSFGKRLPLTILLDMPTVEQVVAIMTDKKPPVSWSLLVPIQTEGSKPPLFCMHAAGGNVLIYRDLARHLGPDQPVYGVQAQGLDGKQPLLTRVEEMAAIYAGQIQAIQPTGPYLLAGYCLGGTLAIEIAQQLNATGHEVALVALFETYNWGKTKGSSIFDAAYFYFQKVEFHLRNFLLLDSTEGKLTFLREKLAVLKRRRRVFYGLVMSKLGRITRQGEEEQWLPSKMWQTNDLAALEYNPRIYPGRITEFRARKEYACYRGRELGWQDWAIGGVETHIVPVYPASMLVEPFVEHVADILKDCIERSLVKTISPDGATAPNPLPQPARDEVII